MASSSESVWVLGAALLLSACAGRTVPLPATSELLLQSTAGEAAPVSALLSRAEATVVVFWSAGCPCVRRYQERVDALAAQWAGRVQFLEVSSNAGETLESVRAVARQRALLRPVWRDEGGLFAQALGARSTPTVVLLKRDGQVLFRGWVDNERLPGEAGREPWLEQALTAFASGAPASARSPTWGCTITRSLAPSQAPQCHVPSHEVASSQATSPGGTP